MVKLSGRPGRTYDENWICEIAKGERRYGGRGPFSHEGVVRIPMYVIRSAENAKAIQEEKIAFKILFEEAKAGKKPLPVVPGAWNEARPGDVAVDRALRAVYVIHGDGSRRRCTEPAVATFAIDRVKQQLEEIRRGNAPAGE